MKVLIVGVFSNKWSTNNEMLRSLRFLGHDVDYFDYRLRQKKPTSTFSKLVDKFFSSLRRLPISSLLKERYYFLLGRDDVSNDLNKLIATSKYDLVIYSKTDTLSPENIRFATNYSKTWYYFMDPYFVCRNIGALKYVANATYCSATFKSIYSRFKSINPNSFWMTQGYDPSMFFVQPEKKLYDAVFVGTKTPYRQRIMKALLESSLKISAFGVGWQNPPIYGDDLRRLYNSSKVVLNFCRSNDGFSIRVVQAMACGAAVVSDYSDDLAEIFTDYQNIVLVRNIDEFLSHIHDLISNPALLDAISSEGVNICEQKFTWESKMVDMMSIVSNKR